MLERAYNCKVRYRLLSKVCFMLIVYRKKCYNSNKLFLYDKRY